MAMRTDAAPDDIDALKALLAGLRGSDPVEDEKILDARMANIVAANLKRRQDQASGQQGRG